MQLLQLTTAFLLLCNLCSSQDSSDTVITPPASSSPTYSTTTVSSPTTNKMPATDPIHSTPEIPKGTTSKDSSKTPLVPAVTSIATAKSVDNTTLGVTKKELITTNTTGATLPLSDAVPTFQGSQHTKNQSSIKMTTMSASTQQPVTSPSKTTGFPLLPSTSATPPRNISQLQGTEDGKNATSPPTIPSYSSIILPVVIALIVITLSVFVLVGLYRMCWKKDPGTPENGNDQPQSDKESVKLLTVKTISHESGLNFSNCLPGMEMEEVWPNQS
ncbi:endomucin isoform X2 [Perognathus longimembris pacificus]|uniref:endomucin isoform X2 n=1 Tax=Perognathus longimembris pacificus TaxID=214514 RepID=UPI002019E90C|nr:endomucin isoform X2 [Perognathus longimembris pacificus]